MTIIPRITPFMLAHRIKIPLLVVTWLRLMPPAILASLLIPGIFFMSDSTFKEGFDISLSLLASLVTVVMFRCTRGNFMVAFLAGIFSYAILINI